MKRLLALALLLLLVGCSDCNCRRGSMQYGTRLNDWSGQWEYCECGRE